jgi:hypothetical protein
MSDGWTDQRNKTSINFPISCLEVTMFLKSMDALNKVKSAQLICEMMEEIIQEVGEENIVQIVPNNATNYAAASRLLSLRIPPYFAALALHVA